MDKLAAATHEPAMQRGHGERVLVVEDSASLRRSVMVLLKVLNYDGAEAANAAEALHILQSRKVDVLFTDLLMPGGMNGLELARAVRLQSPGTRILITSGVCDMLAQHAAAPDLDDIPRLAKPFRLRQLADALAYALRAAQA